MNSGRTSWKLPSCTLVTVSARKRSASRFFWKVRHRCLPPARKITSYRFAPALVRRVRMLPLMLPPRHPLQRTSTIRATCQNLLAGLESDLLSVYACLAPLTFWKRRLAPCVTSRPWMDPLHEQLPAFTSALRPVA